jgi:hypothetical protein
MRTNLPFGFQRKVTVTPRSTARQHVSVLRSTSRHLQQPEQARVNKGLGEPLRVLVPFGTVVEMGSVRYQSFVKF